MKRLVFIAALLACSKPGPGLVDGGGFVLPDGGFRDAGEAVFDSGAPDTGPFVCNPACTSSEVCACLGSDCGCHAPQSNDRICDPQVPESCAEGLACVRARREGIDLHVCSDGSSGTSCSHTQDVCTTALGCVCLTPPTGLTDCRCTDSVSDPALCDPMVPASCPGNVCVRVDGPNGAYFVCSPGEEGDPCDPGRDNCQTSIGCSCPLVDEIVRCSCSEPSGEGGPCDVNVPGSCVSPLMCVVAGNPIVGRSTVCSSGLPPGRDGGVLCDPNDPSTCPPGQSCEFGPNGWECV